MKLAAMFGSSSGAIGATAVGAVVLVGGAIGVTVFNADPEPPAPPPAALVEEAPVAAVEPAPDPSPSPSPTPSPEPEVAQGPEAAPEFIAPLLDLVRVDPGGNTVIAGRTSPDLPVALLLDGLQIAETRADAGGDFVVLLNLPFSDAPRLLSVEARPESGAVLAGVETVLVAPLAAPEPDVVPEAIAAADPVETPADVPEAAAPEVIVAEVDPAPDDVTPASVVPEDPLPDLAAAEDVIPGEAAPAEDIAAIVTVDIPQPEVPATTAETPPPAAPGALAAGPAALAAPSVTAAPASLNADTRPAALQPARAMAPSVVIASPEGLRVVQGPADEPAVQTSVRLDAISYDAEGAVILAGRGPVAANIQITLNNQPIQLGEVGPGGDWSLQLPDVDPGTYTLAVTELSEDGAPVSRVETPFLREDPERVAETPVQEAAGIDVITVQPGFTLWGMARDTFGEGILYVQIFEENRDQIRDPNWIFPGQIFRMPDLDSVADGN
ncbi:LysM peptidoglycan-binding domain-containing protein [Gymnodinialimonas sp.]